MSLPSDLNHKIETDRPHRRPHLENNKPKTSKYFKSSLEVAKQNNDCRIYTYSALYQLGYKTRYEIFSIQLYKIYSLMSIID